MRSYCPVAFLVLLSHFAESSGSVLSHQAMLVWLDVPTMRTLGPQQCMDDPRKLSDTQRVTFSVHHITVSYSCSKTTDILLHRNGKLSRVG